MKKLLLFLFFYALVLPQGFTQNLKPFQIYNKEKDSISFSEMIEELSGYDVVLFGENHDDAMIHWLELKTTQSLYEVIGNQLVLGAEMFERDNQNEIDSYLTDSLNVEGLEQNARLWPNFHTDYKPLLDFAKKKNLSFIATNIPRRYASMVAKHGVDTLAQLTKEEQCFMAKMPIEVDTLTPGYNEMADMMKEHTVGDPMDFVAAQAVKDATMAESINKEREAGQLFLHYNGNFHSKAYGGLFWYLQKENKDHKIAVITVHESDKENLEWSDDFEPTEFTIVVPSDMTKTY